LTETVCRECVVIIGNQSIKQRFLILDAFRGIAALWIVLFHVLSAESEMYWPPLKVLITNGHLGFEIFFVISGYSISASVYKLRGCQNSWLSFIRRRLSRIYVPYFFSLFTIVIFIPFVSSLGTLLKGHLTFYYSFSRYLDITFLEWLEYITLLRVFNNSVWFLANAFWKINGALWYVAIVVQMYFVVTLTLLSGHYYKIIIVLLLSLSCLTSIESFNSILLPGLFLPYWLHCCFGALLFYAINTWRTLSLTCYTHIIIYISIVVFYGLIGYIILSSCFTNTIFCFFSAIQFWLLFPLDTIVSKVRLFSCFIFLGSFSYSLYLLHNPLNRFLSIVVRNIIPAKSFVTYPFIIIPLIVVISYYWYFVFERPGSFKGSMNNLIRPFRIAFSFPHKLV
jgi:peptidoglycan/LPS O-acetylase OafA/YrhL